MARLLQLLDGTSDFQTRRCVGQLKRGLGSEFEVLVRTIGSGGDWRSLPSAILSLRNEKYDLIHAWGLRALTAAALTSASRLVFSPTHFPTRNNLRWLRAIQSCRAFRSICSSATLQRNLLKNGIPAEQCTLIRPGVDFAQINRHRNSDIRKLLGLSDNDFVVFAPGESTSAANHHLAVWALAILHHVDPHCKLLLWGRGNETPSLLRFAEKLKISSVIIPAEKVLRRPIKFEELLPAANSALITADQTIPTLPIAICMAAPLPIITTATSTVAELLEDRHNALMPVKPIPRLIAQRILDLRADDQLKWKLTDTARSEAYEYFPLSHFLEEYRAFYGETASAGCQLPLAS